MSAPTATDALRCLTVRQPLAWAIITGRKLVENRTKPTKHRGRLLIHSALTPTDEVRLADGSKVPQRLYYGAILGSVQLVDCVPLAEAPRGPFTVGPFCWLLADPRPWADPAVATGQLGLWRPPASWAHCDHCRAKNTIVLGVESCLCAQCGRAFPVTWED